MRKIPWKAIIILGAVSAILILGYLIISSQNIQLLPSIVPEKIIILKNTTFAGFEEGKKVFEIFAEEGWIGRAQDSTTFENVKNGKVYKEDSLFVKNLTARRIRTYRYTKDIEIFSKGEEEREGLLKADINLSLLGKGGKKARFASFSADHLKYNPINGKSFFDGDIVIRDRKLTISGEKMEIDSVEGTGFLEGNLCLKAKDASLSGGTMKMCFRGDIATIESRVALGARGKAATGERAIYSGKEETITLKDNVKAIFEKGEKLITLEKASYLKNPEAKIALSEATILTGDELKIPLEKKDAYAKGNVIVEQKGRIAKANNAEYISKDDIIVLTGNVYLKQGDDWLKTQKVIVSVKNETFEALGGIEAEFKLRR